MAKHIRPTKLPNSKWRIRPTDEFGKRVSQVFEQRQDADLALKRIQVEVQEKKRGIQRLTPSRRTFGEACRYWMENRDKRDKRKDASIIKCHLGPSLGKLLLTDVTRDRVDHLRSALSKKLGVKTVHNVLTLLISILNQCVELEWLDRVPKIRKPKVSIQDSDFNYLKTQEEIDKFLWAARGEDASTYFLYLTAIYTGMRAGELAGLRWEDIDLDPQRRLITVQRSYLDRTKSGKIRRICIMDALYPALKEWRLKSGGKGWVFPTQTGTMQQRSARVFQEVFHRVLDHAGFPKIEKNGRPRRYIVFHDLRHTFASQWMMKGGDLFAVQKLLGHSTSQMTMRYTHMAPEAYKNSWSLFPEPKVAEGDVLPFSMA